MKRTEQAANEQATTHSNQADKAAEAMPHEGGSYEYRDGVRVRVEAPDNTRGQGVRNASDRKAA